MMRFTKKLAGYLLPAFLFLTVICLSWANYTPGTWLAGWDSLHPEFNFSLNLQRALTGVWRSEQGLGALAAHSHMGEIPRILYLWASSLILPTHFLRYFYFFTTLVVGILGAYFFLKKALPGKGRLTSSLAATIGALYFLFNFATLQLYYVPFEMFAAQFAFLPWLFLFGYQFIKEGDKRALLIFAVLSLLSSPMAFAATLFYAYFAALAIFLFTYSILFIKPKRTAFKKSLIILALVFATNAYWIFPNFYSIANQSQEISQSRINTLFSSEAFLSNKAYGDIGSVLIGKNHLFAWREYNFERGEYAEVLEEWNNYLARRTVLPVAYALAAFYLIGLVLTLVRKDRVGIALFPVFFFALFFLINENPPFTAVYSLLRENIGLFSEGLRMPFTKFSLIFQLTAVYYLSYFASFIFGLFSKIKITKPLIVLGFAFLISTIFYTAKPAFSGHFISPSMRVSFPSEYFELFEYFKNKPGRIANLPLHTQMAWTYHNWGYQGAGFTPFGLQNPILDRDFDRWSAQNESFYNEIASAVYQKDIYSIENVLEKYQVSYLLWDKSVFNALGEEDILFTEELEELLSESGKITKEKEIGFLSIYKINLEKAAVWSPSEYRQTNLDFTYSTRDWFYEQYGDYIKTETSTAFPFANLDTRAGVEFTVKEGSVHAVYQYPKPLLASQIVFPSMREERTLPVEVYVEVKENNTLAVKFIAKAPKVILNDTLNLSGREFTQVHEKQFPLGLPTRISIDGATFNLSVLGTEERYLGEITLSTTQENNLSFFRGEVGGRDIVDNFFNQKPRLCANPLAEFPLVPKGSGFELYAEAEAICLGQNFSLVRDSLFSISFTADTQDGIFPQVCLTDGVVQRCLDADFSRVYLGQVGVQKHFSFTSPLEAGSYWIDFVAANPLPERERKIMIDNMNISKYNKIDEINYAIAQNLSKNFVRETVALEKDISKVEVIFPQGETVAENIAMARGNIEAINCDFDKPGTVSKEISEDRIIYRAEDGGASCDYFFYPRLDYSQTYLVRIKGENREGRGLKIYLFDSLTSKSNFEDVLPAGSFDYFFVIPPKSQEGSGYTLSFETRAFGRIASENMIENIEFIPIPAEWLSQVRLQPAGMMNNELGFTNNLSVKNFVKKGQWFYKVETKQGPSFAEATEGQVGLLVLGQGYEDGWIAISYPAQFKILDHVKVNSWANGWIVSPSLEYPVSNIYIIFWPQLLQYVGFGLLIIAIGMIALSRCSNTKQHRMLSR